jgi:cytochrome c-type biogenesis protein CcsB
MTSNKSRLVRVALSSVFLLLTSLVPMTTPARAADATAPVAPAVTAPPVAAPPVEKATPHTDWSFTDFRHTPIQSGGRVKPLDSFAREATLFLTGRRQFENWDPSDLLMSWIANPRAWEGYPFVKVSRIDVRRELQLDENRTYFTPRELFGNFALLQYAQHMDAKAATGSETMSGKTDRGAKVGPRDAELREVLGRLELFRDVVAGTSWLVIPRPGGAAWVALAPDSHVPPPVANANDDRIRSHFVDLVKSYKAGDGTAFERASRVARAGVEGEVPAWDGHLERSLALEVFYNRVRPFEIAWIFYLAGALMWLVAPGKITQFKRSSDNGSGALRRRAAMVLTGIAITAHVVGFGIRCYIAGRPPVTNMYESIIWVSFGVFAFSFILYLVQRLSITIIVGSVMASIGLIAADAAPAMMDPGLHPLVPVLRDNFWLTIHVLTITLGYSAFALTLGLGDVTLWNFFSQDRAKSRATPGTPAASAATQLRIQSLTQLTYRAMQFGVVLLAAGTILGGVWADYSWGRFWGWDPKEVWALIALLCYLAVLHGRMTSWIKPFAFAAWTVVAFSSVVMAWYGVNFVLGVGLHSYGFASGGTGYVIAGVGAQLSYVILIAIHHAVVNRTITLRPAAPMVTPS